MNWDNTRLFVLITYAQKLHLNIHDDVTNGAKGLKFGWSLHFIYIHPLGMRALKALVSLYKCSEGAQWLSGRVLDSRPKGRGFEPHRRHCVVVFEQDIFILA